MRITENALNILTAKSYLGIGKAWIIKNLSYQMPLDQLVRKINSGAKIQEPITIENFKQTRTEIHEKIKLIAHSIDGVVAIGDDSFPPHRGNVKNGERPIVLFYRGNLDLLDIERKNVAVIGLLNPDESTEDKERELVKSLVEKKLSIVSGLALGCDTIAHSQAIRSEGLTIAALPSPIDDIIPASNKVLAESIINNNGLIISEYYENPKSKLELNGRYVERDRLQALFSDCVILTASYSENKFGNDSGSRHAMKYADSYHILRAVMYEAEEDSKNPKYELNKQLLMEDEKVISVTNNVQELVSKIEYEKSRSPHYPSPFQQDLNI